MKEKKLSLPAALAVGVAVLAAVMGIGYLLSRVPWVLNHSVQLTAAWFGLAGALGNVVCAFFKNRDSKAIRTFRIASDVLLLAAMTIRFADLMA